MPFGIDAQKVEFAIARKIRDDGRIANNNRIGKQRSLLKGKTALIPQHKIAACENNFRKPIAIEITHKQRRHVNGRLRRPRLGLDL